MTVLASSRRYWHTLRHLKPVQWYGRLWFRLWRPAVDMAAPAPSVRPIAGAWQPPARRASSMRAADRFCFLNHEHSLPRAGGWNDPTLEKLWLYNLHYFDDLNATGAATRAPWHLALMQRWVAENPPTAGNGWEPYPTSLRMVNWVKWALAGHSLPAACMQSLAVQARWLAARMEWHLLGNHLFANAKALVFAGLFFEGPEARKWLATGLGVIAKQLPEQVLPDGGHFERSTMYHALFLEDLLDLVNAAAAWPGQIDAAHTAAWREAAGKMLEWLQGLLHPDGQIAFFNDAALGIAPEPAALREYAQRLGLEVRTQELPQTLCLRHWPSSGYVRLSSPQAVALLDVAAVGPDYLPGHAHADTLSFELSVAGQRVVVNGGTSCYGLGSARAHERSTRAHSTVEVARQDSSEVWSAFRVARRAYPFDFELTQNPDRVWVACSHDGYRRLPGNPVHRRGWSMDSDSLTVSDTVSDKPDGCGHRAVARFVLHPAARVTQAGPGEWRVTLPRGREVGMKLEHGCGHLEPALYAPEFGKTVETQCVTVDLAGGRSVMRLSW